MKPLKFYYKRILVQIDENGKITVNKGVNKLKVYFNELNKEVQAIIIRKTTI